MELSLLVGLANMVNRFHDTFHTDVEQEIHDRLGENCQVPMPQPPG